MIPQDDFYVTIPSNARLGKRNDNRPGRFESKLPVTYNMSGEWQTALTSIIYPKPTFSTNIDGNVGFFLIAIDQKKSILSSVELTDEIYHRRDDKHISDSFSSYVGSNKKKYYRKFNVKSHYNNAIEIAEHLTSEYLRVVTNTFTVNESNKDDLVVKCQWTFNQSTQKLVADVGNDLKTNDGKVFIFFPNKSLGKALGYKEFVTLVNGSTTVGVIFDVLSQTTPVNAIQSSPIFIYMDILKDSIVGDVLCPKLAIIPTSENEDQNKKEIDYYSPARLEYMDVKSTELNIIHTKLCDCFGHEVLFNDTDHPVIIGLHFRRRQLI